MIELPKTIQEVKAYQKPHDSIFSTLFTRRISRVFTFFLVRNFSWITPNQVSTLSFIVALMACGLFIQPNYAYRIIGVVLLQISFALDCSDGEIARLKNLGSKFGAWYDSVNDRIKEICMFSALTYAWYLRHPETYVILVGFGTIIGWLLIAYLREAKKSSWPNTRTAEIYISKSIYLGSVDIIIYLVSAAVLVQIEFYILGLFLVLSLPLIIKQMLSAWKLGKQDSF